MHNVTVTKDSFLYKIYGAEFGVNSSHHQAIKEIGNGFDVAATADNTTIEGIIHKELPIFGVQ